MKHVYTFPAQLLRGWILFLALALPFVSSAQTWADDVAPIFYANCTKCHNPNGIAPFSLITYNDGATNASAVSAAVQAGTMPPWPPDTTYRKFCGQRSLSPQDINTIVHWVNAGMPSGNLSNAPPQPTYSGAAELANPDLMAQMPLYTVNAATDLYRCFVFPNVVSATKFITQLEIVPGNRNIVHHVLIYQDNSNTCINLDNNDPGPGYTYFGGVGSVTATLIGGWVPGTGMYTLPANMGIQLNANTNIIMQIHYPGGTFNQVDSTQFRFKFSTTNVRTVYLNPILNYWSNITPSLYIPHDSVKTFKEQQYIGANYSLITVAPHMHLIGHSIVNYAVDATHDTTPLIRINDWNFHWQGFYNFRQPVHITPGSTLYAFATYDNTATNPYNPNSPPQDVSAGDYTTDEMMIVYYGYLPYQAGDENIVIDSTLMDVPQSYGDIVKTPQLYDPYPVPANNSNQLNIQFFLPQSSGVRLELLDAQGKTVSIPIDSKRTAGFNSDHISLEGLASGTYILRMTAGNTVRTKMVVVSN